MRQWKNAANHQGIGCASRTNQCMFDKVCKSTQSPQFWQFACEQSVSNFVRVVSGTFMTRTRRELSTWMVLMALNLHDVSQKHAVSAVWESSFWVYYSIIPHWQKLGLLRCLYVHIESNLVCITRAGPESIEVQYNLIKWQLRKGEIIVREKAVGDKLVDCMQISMLKIKIAVREKILKEQSQFA